MKKNLRFFLALGLCGLMSNLYSQEQQAFFLESVSSNGVQNMFYRGSGVKNSNNDLYTAGATLDGTGHYNILITKHNSSNQLQWTAEYAGSYGGDDYAADIAFDANGDVIIVGTIQTDSLNYDAVVMKYNTSGTQQWVQTYAGAANLADGFTTVETDANNNVYVSGGSVENVLHLTDIVTRKYNSSGTLLWSYVWNSSYSMQDASYRILFASGNVNVYGASQTGVNPVTWKLSKVSIVNSTGALYGSSLAFGETSELDQVTDVAIESQNYVMVCGTKTVSGQGKNFRVIRYDNDLEQIWMYEYNGAANGNDEALDLVMSGSQNVYVTGYTTHATEGENVFTTKISVPYGTASWTKNWDGGQSTNDRGASIEINGSGDVYVGANSYKDGNEDVVLLKFKGTNGSKLAEGRYNGDDNGDDKAGNMVLISGGVYLASQITKGAGLSYALTKWTEKTIYLPDFGNEQTSEGFQKNRGQLTNDDRTENTSVKMYNSSGNTNIYLGDSLLSVVYAEFNNDSMQFNAMSRFDIKWLKRSTTAKMFPYADQAFYTNYYIAERPMIERVYTSDYAVVTNLYSNTDLFYTTCREGVFIALVARPGAPYTDYSFEVNGSDSTYLNSTGDLTVETSLGNYILPRPKAYSMNNSTGILTLLNWQPSFNLVNNEVSFTGLSSITGTLVILMGKESTGSAMMEFPDNIDWSTYYGIEESDFILDIDDDAQKNIYTSGHTYSNYFPLSVGNTSYLSEDGGSADLFVGAFHREACYRSWMCVFGGQSTESAMDVLFYDASKLFVTGKSMSPNLLFFDNGWYFDDTPEEEVDYQSVFALIFDPFSGELIHSTKLCTEEQGYYFIESIPMVKTTDGDLYICSSGNGRIDFPITGSGFSFDVDQSNEVWPRGMIMRFNQEGVLTWSTKFGSERTLITELLYDEENDDIYVIGAMPQATEEEFPKIDPGNGYYFDDMAGTTQYPSYKDGFILRFNSVNEVTWGTYFGSDENDKFTDGVFYDGTLILGGNWHSQSSSSNASLIPLLQSSTSAYYDDDFDPYPYKDEAFICRFNQGQLEWSTFFGGEQFETIWDMGYTNGQLVLVGNTSSEEFPTQNLPGWYMDYSLLDGNGYTGYPDFGAFIAMFNSENVLKWSTHFDGDQGAELMETGDALRAVKLTSDNMKLYAAGAAISQSNYPWWQFSEELDNDWYDDENIWPEDQSSKDATLLRMNLEPIIVEVNEFQDVKTNILKCYPNPSSEKLNVHIGTIDKRWNYSIFNSIGELVVSELSMANNFSVDVSSCGSGIYLLIVTNEYGEKYTANFEVR